MSRFVSRVNHVINLQYRLPASNKDSTFPFESMSSCQPDFPMSERSCAPRLAPTQARGLQPSRLTLSPCLHRTWHWRHMHSPLPLTQARCGREGVRQAAAPRGACPSMPTHWPAGSPRLYARTRLDPGRPGGGCCSRRRRLDVVVHWAHEARARAAMPPRWAHPTRWQPCSWNAGA